MYLYIEETSTPMRRVEEEKPAPVEV